MLPAEAPAAEGGLGNAHHPGGHTRERSFAHDLRDSVDEVWGKLPLPLELDLAPLHRLVGIVEVETAPRTLRTVVHDDRLDGLRFFCTSFRALLFRSRHEPILDLARDTSKHDGSDMELHSIEGGGPPSWLELRATGIGGSELSAAMGINPWDSPYSLWARKVGLTKPGDTSERMEWGKRHEDTLARWYAEETGLTVYRPKDDGFLAALIELGRGGSPRPSSLIETRDGEIMLRGDDHPWLLATPDAIIVCPDRGLGTLELKCTDRANKPQWKNKDGPRVPPYYRVQVEAYMYAMGTTWGSVAVMFGFDSAGWVDVEPDPELRAEIIDAGSEMWRRIVNGPAPDVDASEATRRALNEQHDESLEPVHRLDESMEEYDELYMQAKQEIAAAKKRKDFAENKIRQAIGTRGQARLPSGVVWYPKEITVQEHTVQETKYTRFYRTEKYVGRRRL